MVVFVHRRGSRVSMSIADETLRAESRMTVVFGALTSKPEPLTFEESLRFVKKVKVSLYVIIP